MSKNASDWQTIVDGWTASRPSRVNVRVLVHLAMRQDQVDSNLVQEEVFREKRQAYENELTAQATAVGCKGQGVADGATLNEMHDQANEESVGITNTYNYDLANYIDTVRAANPKANRNTYVKALTEWHSDRASWKNLQVSLVNQVTWKSRAAADFVNFNSLAGTAKLVPSSHAVCAICKMWIARGDVPIAEAAPVMEAWPPHPNCVHTWQLNVDKKNVRCENLWLGSEPAEPVVKEVTNALENV